MVFTLVIPAGLANTEHTLIIDRFQRLYVDDVTEPPSLDKDGWNEVTLKDIWNFSRRQQHREAWYRTSFDITALLNQNTQPELALFIPRISSNVSVWINGVEIGNTGPFSEPMLINWNQPVFLPIPKQLIKSANNELAIRLKVETGILGMLFESYVGERATLEARYNHSYFWKNTAPKIMSALMLAISLIVLTFYFAVKLPIAYFWFTLGTIAWVLFDSVYYVRSPRLFYLHWGAVIGFALLTAFTCYLRCATALFELRRPKRHKLTALMWLALSVYFIFFAHISNPLIILTIWLWIGTMFVSLVYDLCLQPFFKNTPHKWLYVVIGLSLFGFSVRDIWALSTQSTQAFALFPYLPLMAVLAGSATFFRRLIVNEKENQSLKAQQQNVATEARKSALKEERQRLMQEIHDGVGGQLVSTLARLERNNEVDPGVVESLRTSIDDLRLIVHSLESLSQQGDVVTLLATIRERMERGLREQGIKILWQVRPLPSIENFSSEHALQLMRIVQEAIANTVKHAQATTITLSCEPRTLDEHEGVVITIADNGNGFDHGLGTVGFGLRNMKERAAKLGAKLTLQSNARGTFIELWLPLSVQPLGEMAT